MTLDVTRSLLRPLSVVGLLLLASGGVQTSAAPLPARLNSWTTPHVLTISDGGDPNTLNPHLGQSAPVANLSEMTMAWLLRWDHHNEPYPELATEVPSRTNGGVSADGLIITYHIRKGVRWSDGVPFTADDVVFSTEVVNNRSNDEAARFGQIASITEPDTFTVVYHLKRPDVTFIESLFSSCCANPSILPKHLLGKYANINKAPYNDLPVGIGPFKFARWDRGKQVVLVANPLYWRGKPKLDKVVYKIIPNRDELLAQLAQHKVDMWYQFSGAYLGPIQALGSYAILRRPSYAFNHFDFNLSHAIVSDIRVRRALRLALDRQGIVARLHHGVGVVKDAPMPVQAPYFSDFGATPYDLSRANSLLDEGGWARGADGIRVKNGVKLDLTAAVAAGQPDTDKELDLVRTDWKRIGVDLNVEHYPPALMFAPAQQGGIIYGGKWDVVFFAWAADPLGDYSALYGCNAFPPDGQNVLHWCDPAAQKAMTAFFGHYEQSQRSADIRIVMQKFLEDVPSVVSALREDIFAYNRDLKNYDPNSITPFDDMMNVDI